MANDSFMNVSLAEAITMSVDDLIVKACANEKGQKGLVKRLATTQKDEVLEEISPKSAIKAITSQLFISSVEGRKLARHFVQKLGIATSWDEIVKHIKMTNPNKYYCHYIGQILMDLWKKLDKQLEVDGDDEVDENAQEANDVRQIVESVVFQEVFKNAILLRKEDAVNYLNMLNGMVEERNSAGSHMLTRIASELLWKALDATNGKVRFNAANVFFGLYPMSCPDIDLGFDIEEKEHECFLALLMDDCVLIRINAIKKIIKTMASSWVKLKHSYVKEYLAMIIDDLSIDDAAEVRLTVYVCLPMLFDTKTLHGILEHAVKIVAPRGLIDPICRNRVAALKMLLKADSKLPKHVYELIRPEVLLASLDLEKDASISLDMVKLIFPYMEPVLKNIDDGLTDVGKQRLFFRKMEEICSKSRNGTLKFFSKLSDAKLLTPNEISAFITILISRTLNYLKILNPNDTLNETLGNKGVDFKRAQNLIDCAIVAFASCQDILIKQDDRGIYEMAVKVMLKMIERILKNNVYSNTYLADSALTAASYISKSIIEEFKEKNDVDLLEIVKNGMQNSPSTAHKLRLYIQAFAMWNIEEFCYIVKQRIREMKRDNLLLKDNASRGKSMDNLKKPIIFLLTALNYGPSGGILIKDYGYLLVECNKLLNAFLKKIPKLTDATEEEDFWLNVYDLRAVLLIICASEASANAKGYMENKNEKEEVITFDTFNHEVKWFENKFKAGLFTSNFILKFIICAPLYFEGNEQKLKTCEAATALFESLKNYAENQENGQEMKKALSKLGKAIKEAAPFSRIDPDLSAIHEEEESMAMDEVYGNEEDDL